MKKRNAFFAAFLAFAAFNFCLFQKVKAQSNHVLLTLEHQVAGEPLLLGTTIFEIWNGKKIRLDRAEFYLSEIALRQPDGSETQLLGQYILVNGNGLQKEADLGAWPISTATGAHFGIGVPDSVNHFDPASWPVGHPLAPQNPSMHWGWAAGYRHLAVEGKVDADGDGVLESYFQWHNIFDPLFRSVEIAGELSEAANGKLYVRLKVDWASLFDGLEMSEDALVQHGGDPENVQMMDNAAAGNFLFWPQTVGEKPVFGAEKMKILAAPNPFFDQTRLQWVVENGVGEGFRLDIFDAFGRRVRSFSELPRVGSLDLFDLETGLFEAVFSEKGGREVGVFRLLRI